MNGIQNAVTSILGLTSNLLLSKLTRINVFRVRKALLGKALIRGSHVFVISKYIHSSLSGNQ